LTDAQCRPIAFMLTGGQIADCTAGAALIEKLPACEILHADKGYDSNAIREQVQAHGAMPNIQLSRKQIDDVVAYMETLKGR
jgi:transposase